MIGIAGSEEKCSILTDQLGFDVAINYNKQNIKASKNNVQLAVVLVAAVVVFSRDLYVSMRFCRFPGWPHAKMSFRIAVLMQLKMQQTNGLVVR